MEPPELPAPTMLSVIVALSLIGIEDQIPGFTDRLITQLSAARLRSEVVRLHGPRRLPAVIEAQEQALMWLSAIKPFIAPERNIAERKRKR